MLRLQQAQVERLQAAAASREVETCAAGLVFHAGTAAGKPVFTVRALLEVPQECPRRLNFEPPCRLNSEPGAQANI